MEKAFYRYAGPVMEWDRCIMNLWEASTMASSLEEAKRNLSYRFKNRFGKGVRTNISLPGNFTCFVKGGNYGRHKVS